MPLSEEGIYIHNEDTKYEFEVCYYLKFQIISALYSINCINNYKTVDLTILNSESEYLHYYTDHLLYSIGQISLRFIKNKANSDDRLIQLNCSNFRFNIKNYPILSNKKYRNTIEHINEYNEYAIKNFKSVGGFNYLDIGLDEDMMNYIKKNKKNHIYTLDLINKKIYIQRKETELVLDIINLTNELKNLQKSVESFWNIINYI